MFERRQQRLSVWTDHTPPLRSWSKESVSRARARSDGPPHRGARAERQLNGSASSGKALSRMRPRGRERSTSKSARFGPSSVRMSEGLHSPGLAGEPERSEPVRARRASRVAHCQPRPRGPGVLSSRQNTFENKLDVATQVQYVCATRGATPDMYRLMCSSKRPKPPPPSPAPFLPPSRSVRVRWPSQSPRERSDQCWCANRSRARPVRAPTRQWRNRPGPRLQPRFPFWRSG